MLTETFDTPFGEDPASGAQVRLNDGRSVAVRIAREHDEPALAEFVVELGAAARGLRAMAGAAGARDIPSLALWAARPDGSDRIGLLAVDAAGHVVGYAACSRVYGPRAELELVIRDSYRHLGVGAALLERLSDEAALCGIRTFVAGVDVEFPTSTWPGWLAAQRFK